MAASVFAIFIVLLGIYNVQSASEDGMAWCQLSDDAGCQLSETEPVSLLQSHMELRSADHKDEGLHFHQSHVVEKESGTSTPKTSLHHLKHLDEPAAMVESLVAMAKGDSVAALALVGGALFALWYCWANYQSKRGYGMTLGLDTLKQKIVFISYVGIFVTTTFLTKAIADNGPDNKVLVAALFVTKLVISIFLWRIQDGTFGELASAFAREWVLVLKYAIVSLLFALGDVLRMNFIQETSPSAFHVLINIRTIFLCWIWMWVMEYRLLACHWCSIAFISVGCMVKESPHFLTELSQGSFQNSNQAMAYLTLLLLCLCTSLSLVVNEYLLKRSATNAAPMPLNFQNCALYVCGFFWMASQSALGYSRGEPGPVFEMAEWGKLMTPMPLLCLASFTTLGIVTSYFLKVLNCIAKEVGTGVEVLCSVPLDRVIFGTHLGIPELIGSAMVMFGIDIFARWPINSPPADGEKKEADMAAAQDLLNKCQQKNDKTPR